MATKRKTTRRRSYARSTGTGTKRRTTRRRSTLNGSVIKSMQSAGVVAGLVLVYGSSIISAVNSKSVKPLQSAVTNKEMAINAAKNVAVGYIGGTIVGKVADKTGLKRPINKVKKTVKGLI